MNILSWALLALVAFWIVWAIIHIVRRGPGCCGNGGCSGCTGSCKGCHHNCRCHRK